MVYHLYKIYISRLILIFSIESSPPNNQSVCSPQPLIIYYSPMIRHIVCLLLLLAPAISLTAVAPIELSPNTENSPSVYLFPFKLAKTLPSSGYLLVTFPNYQSAVTPTSCTMVNQTSITVSCANFLNSQVTGQTISVASVNSVNPNINAQLTVVVDLSTALSSNTNYYLQIVLSNVIPSTARLSDNFQMYSISYNSIIYQQNWNYGQVQFQGRQTNTLAVTILTPMTSVLPGSTNTLQIGITIAVNVATTYSRIKMVLQDPFNFRLSSIVTTMNDPLYSATNGSSQYIAPTILNTVILTPNVIITTFNEQLVAGRKFIFQVTDISAPFTRSSSTFSVYSLPFNSIKPYQSSQLSIPIQTTYFPLTVTLGLPQNMPMSDPIQFYLNNAQYMAITIVSTQEIPSGYSIYLSIPAVSIIPGTAFASTSTATSTRVIYNFTTNTVMVSGFGTIVAGSTITITLKGTVNSASMQVFAMIDQSSLTFPVASPLFYGATGITTAVTPTSFMTDLRSAGSGGGEYSYNLYSMTTTASTLQLTIYATDSSTGSFLDIFMSSYVTTSPTFSPSTSCTVGGSVVPCVVNYQPTYINFQISSTSSSNYFPVSTSVIVVINNLKYTAASSHGTYIYPLFFRFTRSQAVNSITYSWMYTPNVLLQRNQMANNFLLTISNQLSNAGANYPNVLRLHSTDPTAWTYVTQANELRVISVYAIRGYRSSFAVPNLNQYPCASNIAVKCMYTQGVQSFSLNTNTVLDWDRVDIFLQGSQSSSNFHIIIPDIFQSTNTHYFEVIVGKYHTITRQYTYYYMQNTIVWSPSGSAYTTKTQISTTLLQLTGKAGSYADSIQVDIAPVSTTYSLATSPSAIIIVSSWQLYNSLSSLNSTNNNNSVLTFGTNQNSPLFLTMTPTNYLTFIPFAATTTTAFSFYINNLHLPYTYDLPYYSIFLINNNGYIDSYNEFINRNAGVFYYSVLSGLTISCIDNSLGVMNTACFIQFQNNHELVLDGKIYIDFSGMVISTNLCYLTYTATSVSNTSIPVTCASTSNQTRLIISLPGTSATNYPNTNSLYNLLVYGVGILNTSISQSITLTLRDYSGSYIIQTGTRLLTTTVANPLSISISQITYKFNNPIVKSSMFIAFQLPRRLYQDETFVMIMGKDLSDSNTLVQKLNIQLTTSNGNTIQTIQSLSSTSYKLTFTVADPTLIVAGNYTLSIFGLQIPSSNTNDIFYIIYQRNFDNLYSLTNTISTTAPFPSVSSRINSLITLDTFLNTQGLEQQLNFNITHTDSLVDSNTVWYVNLPIYYTPTVWNDDTLAYCQISGTMLPCQADPKVPYQINIHDSPRIINAGTQYTLSIIGIPAPRKLYLNNNATYTNQYVFIGVAANSSSGLFQQYTELYPNQAVVSASSQGTFGMLRVFSIQSSSLNCFSNSYFKVGVYSVNSIPTGSYIYITFPKEFDNLHDISLQVLVLQSSTLITSQLCPVINRRVELKLTGALSAASSFSVEFSNLPTPRLAGTSNMNQMSVIVAASDKSVLLAATTVKTNQAPILTFISNSRYISLNSDNTVEMTAGTYSSPVTITSSDAQKFLSNVKLTSTATGFVFKQNPTRIFLGDLSRTFIIGADMNLMPTYYVYSAAKTETSLIQYYTVLTNNNIRVTNTPISISVPSALNVPKGGCSSPWKVTLNNPPYTDVSINFVYNNSLYSSDIFWVNPQTTNSQLQFTSTLLTQWISFCSSSTITAASVPVTMVLGGTNYLSYSLSNTLLTVNIQSGVTNTAPTLNLNQVNLLKTVAVYNFTANTNGFIFYSLQLGSGLSAQEALGLKVQIKSNNLILQSQADFLTHIYMADRDSRVNMMQAVTGNNQITFSNLLPQKAYTLCAYLQNQFGEMSTPVCQTFNTQTWGVTSKATIQFTKTLTLTQLNNVLCFFVKEVAAKITNVIDLGGSSCSLDTEPQNYYYKYTGNTFSNKLTKTIVYLISNPQITTDASVSSFYNMYDSSKSLTVQSFSDALSNFSINYISSSTFQGTFDPISAVNMNNGFDQTLFFDTPTYQNNVITIPNVRLLRPGSAYFILQLQKQIFYNTITGQTNITIRMDYPPTAEQILNCVDWNNAAVVGCARTVLNSFQFIDVKFTGIISNSFYKLYYVTANEYPLRPVSDGIVQSATVNTLVYGIRLLVMVCVVVVGLLV